jgi:hypothetical protein
MSETRVGINGSIQDKVKIYGWTVKDQPGRFGMLNKGLLQVSPAYQRNLVESKAVSMASAWSWFACGTIIVGKRNGVFWVIDGQHRVAAAKRRSDIKTLPCLVFESDSIAQEAQGFLDANTGRRPVFSTDKYRAALAADDATAVKFNGICSRLNIRVSATANKARDLKCIAWALSRTKEDATMLETVLDAAIDVSGNLPLHEKVLGSLWHIHKNADVGLTDTRLRARLKKLGAAGIMKAADRAMEYHERRSHKVCAEGVMKEVNKNLQNKIGMGESEDLK